jgi:hypothetical protein
VIQDIRALGVKNWRSLGMNRGDRLKLLEEKKLHTELSNK